MQHTRRISWGIGFAAATALLLGPTGTATAQQLDKGTETTSIDEIDNICGLDVRFQFDQVEKFILVNRGAAQLPTGSVNSTFTAVFTNLSDGRQMSEYGHFRNQDQQVTDNGDGTLTIHEKSVGPLRVVGSDGKLLAVDTAVFAYDILIDDNGTPYDPFDDTFISQTDPYKIVGNLSLRDHDFCTDLVAQIG